MDAYNTAIFLEKLFCLEKADTLHLESFSRYTKPAAHTTTTKSGTDNTTGCREGCKCSGEDTSDTYILMVRVSRCPAISGKQPKMTNDTQKPAMAATVAMEKPTAETTAKTATTAVEIATTAETEATAMVTTAETVAVQKITTPEPATATTNTAPASATAKPAKTHPHGTQAPIIIP